MITAKAKQFIEEYTRRCSNELAQAETQEGKTETSYHEWLSPEDAETACEIEGKETLAYLARIPKHSGWVPANDDKHPPINKEVVALIHEHGHTRVVFAHRPDPNGDAECYDKWGWNIPNVRYWLDCELPL